MSNVEVQNPTIYQFEREGNSAVHFSGQTRRIRMAEELASALSDFDQDMSEATLLAMFRNVGTNGEDVAPFESEELNAETKSIKSKVAASRDYFSANTVSASAIREDFEGWIEAQAREVYTARDQFAEAGVPGQIADGSSARYINAKGLEYNQAFVKSLIGGLMLDQMLNNYLSTSVLDEATNRDDNSNEILVEGQFYTNMEHKWDEAYGYLFGNSSNEANPVEEDLGSADSYLNKYLARVEGDPDFEGIAGKVFEAFKLGRAAIVAEEYTLRDEQARIIRQELSNVIGIRAVYYLQQAKLAFQSGNRGAAFHDLSEGFGFIYSLQFTRNTDTGAPFFSREEVSSILARFYGDLENGFWDVSPEVLDDLSTEIASRFDFTVAQAGE